MTQVYYRDMKTMTKWRKVGDTFKPAGPWLINRNPDDVLKDAVMSGPFAEKEAQS